MEYTLDGKEIDSLFEMILESSVDFPKSTLSPDIWEKQGEEYVLLPDVKSTVMVVLESFPTMNLKDVAKDIWIVGSLTTNLYQDDSDLDVHIHLKDEVPFSEKLQKDVRKWTVGHRVYVGNHVIEIYVQGNPKQDMMSDGVYDVLSDKWLKGPYLVDEDYNPYEIYANVLDKVQEFAKEADIQLGELKRDVIDYQVIKDAYEKLPDAQKHKLESYLDSKLKEIDDSIDELLKDKKEWIDYRRSTPVTTDPDQALKDMEIIKQWKDVNATFKFLNRYGLLKVISALELIKGEDKKITHDEVPAVAAVIGA